MELVFFFILLIAAGMVSYSVCCLVFFGFTRRQILPAFSQSCQLSIASIAGILLLGFGALLLPTIYFNAVLEKQRC